MREYEINARTVKNPIYRAPIDMGGADNKGNELSISNYYLQMNGEPFYAVCGEAHFSRMNEALWEDEIIKMKLGGINIIASYIFWIHHEEIASEFDWAGNKNLRKFIELCRKNEMFVILRIGPFAHGECRNGGFPDWLFGQPFDIRYDDEQYLHYTKRFYEEIYQQAEGLLFKDGGPVIGVQLENEHEHASCPWEMTTENSKEWVVSGRDGIHHMATLKNLAIAVGFEVPLYTATAWGGACAPIETVFPLWGGYAFRPWMFYDSELKEHPATAEYLYGDFHNNEAPKYYNFDPEYLAEDFPYACCEMGGGMNVYYPYRFQLPYESVGAMAQVKVGSGCNYLGYYMYHGGTHPKGKKTPYLNECAVPKFSYDYQAALGEFGQVRKSFHQLKLQHLLYQEFQNEITRTKTILSKEAVTQTPEDVETLRYVVRVDEAGSGFLFINNYQDHVAGQEQKDFAITVDSDLGAIRIPEVGAMNLAKESYAILPFGFEIGGLQLRYATTQLITRLEADNTSYYFFTSVAGMKAEYLFLDKLAWQDMQNCEAKANKIAVANDKISTFSFIGDNGHKYTICTIPEEDSLKLWQVDWAGQRRIVLSKHPVLVKDKQLEFEYPMGEDLAIRIFPWTAGDISVNGRLLACQDKDTIFQRFAIYNEEKSFGYQAVDCSTKNSDKDGILKRPVVGSPISSTKIVNARMTLTFAPEDFEGLKQLMLNVEYEGDVGYAFINGEMFHDNFCNGATWEIDLMPYREELLKHGCYLYVSPKKRGAYVDSSSAMAARFEIAKEQIAKIHAVSLCGIQSVQVATPTDIA